MGKQIINVKSSGVKTKAVADVVFCFDCTGSMSDCIDSVKKNANSFVAGLNADQSTIIDWRMRAIGYGDLECGEKIQNSNGFVSSVAEFQAQVAGIEMCGGGDEPESTLDAIITAAKTSDWRGAHKIVVIFTDAHTKDIHSSTQSTFAINNIDELVKSLADDHIKLFLWGPADPNYEALQKVPKSEITELSDPHAEYKNDNKMEKLLELMGKTVSTESLVKSEVL